METKEFQSQICTFVDNTRRELINKLTEFVKERGFVTLKPDFVILSEDEMGNLYPVDYNKLIYIQGCLFVAYYREYEDDIEFFSIDEILNIINNIQ